MNETHLDIFSGLGGFALAAREAGFGTVAFCESDARCRDFLEKTWGLPVEPDIRKLDGRKYAGVSLLTGGPPCQPASRAGKQGGAGDDRWLWDEALRVLQEAEPDSVVFENPPGILDVGIDGILSEMGRLGYETQCFDIPACAVDSPQLRHRIWIVGFLVDAECCWRREQLRINSARESLSPTKRRESASRHGPGIENGDMADTSGSGHKERRVLTGIRSEAQCPDSREAANMGAQSLMADSERERRERGTKSETERSDRPGPTSDHWQNAIWVPCADGKLRRAPDDSFSLVDGLHRSLLGALGNSIVPQAAVEILKAIRQVL